MNARLVLLFSLLFAFSAHAQKKDPDLANWDADTSAAEDGADAGEEPEDPTERGRPVADAPPPTSAFVTPPEAKTQLQFADHLFLDGDWYRAITEYRRFLFMVKGQGADAARAALAIGEALLRGEQWDAAGRQLDGVAQRAIHDSGLRRTALFAAGRAYLLDGRAQLAKPRFRIIAEDADAPAPIREEATWLLAWGHFDAGELEKAQEIFQSVADAKGKYAEQAAGVVEALGKKDALDQKNIILAGALSLIPGLGHAYLGQYTVGLTSLTWNALFIVAATLAWIQGQWGPAIVLTIFELGWFSGGVFGAISGAYKHNRDAVRNWRDAILAEYGQSRELPDMYEFKENKAALPGSIVRFGIAP